MSPPSIRVPGPALAGGRARRLRVVDAVLGPLEREAGVQDPARIERRLRVVDHRQRRDRREAGRPGGGDEELADAAVGDAEHADLVVQHPGLAGDGLDRVVAVERLQGLEVVEGAARAAGAAHVDVDDRVAEQGGDGLDPALRAGRVGVAVAGVLDQGRVGAVLGGPGRCTSIASLRAVARRQVAVAAPRGPGRRCRCSGAPTSPSAPSASPTSCRCWRPYSRHPARPCGRRPRRARRPASNRPPAPWRGDPPDHRESRRSPEPARRCRGRTGSRVIRGRKPRTQRSGQRPRRSARPATPCGRWSPCSSS